MEKHSLQGRVETKFERAPKALIERLAKHDTAKICDSMGGHGAMNYEIKPLENSMRVNGSALAWRTTVCPQYAPASTDSPDTS